MQKIIYGEEPFQTINSGFSASPSKENITLYFSADGYNYTEYPEGTIEKGNTIEVTNCFSRCLYFKLKGNKSKITVNLY